MDVDAFGALCFEALLEFEGHGCCWRWSLSTVDCSITAIFTLSAWVQILLISVISPWVVLER
jgi:hypothetical protein